MDSSLINQMKNYMIAETNVAFNNPEWLNKYGESAPDKFFTWDDVEVINTCLLEGYLWIISLTHLNGTRMRMEFSFRIDTLDEETIDCWLNYDLDGE